MNNLKLMILFAALLILLGTSAYANVSQSNDKNQSRLKVLVITGTHEYDNSAFNSMFESFNELDCTIKEMGENPGALFDSVENFQYDVIVLYNFRQTLSNPHRENFKSILRAGIGLVVMHHAIAGFPEWREFEDIIGATYVLKEQTRDSTFYLRPKWKHDVEMKIKVEDSTHAITKGVNDFSIKDETYKHWVYHDGNNLLLSTENEYSNRQIAWTRSSLNTRVFFIQLGHGKDAFENKHFRKLLRQGISWSAK